MIEKDVVVVGSGGAGMTAAIVAAGHGLDVLLIEKSAVFGGTTSLSGGGIWVPCSPQAQAAGIADDPARALTYVKQVVGPSLREDLAAAFLAHAPKMVDYLQTHTQAQFALQPGFADWRPDAEGFSPSGRLLTPVDYDGRRLGRHFAQLRPPLSEFNAPGGLMIGLGDMAHATRFTKSFKSFRHMAKLAARYAVDRLRYPRGTRLTMGNALAARLLRSALDAGVEMWRDAPMQRLIIEDGAVRGVVVMRDGREVQVRARRGVVLATGGFSANAGMRAQYIPFADQHVSIVPEGNTGDGLTQALGLGAGFDGDNHSNAGWVVVSVHTRPDGTVSKFPHLFLDRGKPGCIAVNSRGLRFGNEATTNLVEPMHASGSVPAHLICDHRFIRKYGLGLVRPGGFGLGRLLKEGYVVGAPTLEALAERIGIDPAGLGRTVAQFNAYAADGADPDFARGADKADFFMGDPEHRPNPCLGPIETGPFYAVKIFPGDTTTTVGLKVDDHARVLGADGAPIPGLHAIGLDMNSLWRGRAPGAGGNNTLSLTFAYIAAMTLAGNAGP